MILFEVCNNIINTADIKQSQKFFKLSDERFNFADLFTVFELSTIKIFILKIVNSDNNISGTTL